MATITDNRKRGRLLTIWLIVLVFLYTFLAFLAAKALVNYVANQDAAFNSTMQWALPLSMVLAVFNTGAVIALLFWRKVGFYIYAFVSMPFVIINLLLGVGFLAALLPLTSVAILWKLLNTQWKYFH